MTTSEIEQPVAEISGETKPRKKWPLKTVIEVFPIFIALTALLTFGTARKAGEEVELLTPLSRITGALPLWATFLLKNAFLTR